MGAELIDKVVSIGMQILIEIPFQVKSDNIIYAEFFELFAQFGALWHSEHDTLDFEATVFLQNLFKKRFDLL